MKLCIAEDLDVDCTTACKTNWIIPVSFKFSVLVFQLNFSPNYLKDFCHRKFLSTNPSSTNPRPPDTLKCPISAKCDQSFLLLLPQMLPSILTLFSNHHAIQLITISNDYLQGAQITYFNEYFTKYFQQTKV